MLFALGLFLLGVLIDRGKIGEGEKLEDILLLRDAPVR